MTFDDLVVVVYDDHLAIQCPSWQCATIHLGSSEGMASLHRAARDHIQRLHPAQVDTRALDREDGIFYAHQNSLDCRRTPCALCGRPGAV